MAPPRYGRRRFLRGAGGALLALPLLESLERGAARAETHPRRVVAFYTPNGTVKSAWQPTGGEKDFVLGPILGPLEPYRDSVIVVQGVDMESTYHGPGDGMHLNGMAHLLTGIEMVDAGFGTYWAGGVSVDQFLATKIGATTCFSSLEFGVEDDPGTVAARMSYLGSAEPVPPETDPKKMFERLFGVVSAERRAQRKSVLDAIKDDLTSLDGRLGKEDKYKLDEHLGAVRGIEKRLTILPASCPAASLDLQGPFDFPTAGKLQMDLLAMALSCDLTRVATFQWSCAASLTVMDWLGIEDTHHSLSHSTLSDQSSQGKLIEINRWYAQQFAALLGALREIREGDGTLLDHSALLWCNELGEGETHSRRDVPYVLAGGGDGYFKTGRYLKYGGVGQGATHNNLLVSLCHAMGVNVATFGNPAYCTGPLTGLTG